MARTRLVIAARVHSPKPSQQGTPDRQARCKRYSSSRFPSLKIGRASDAVCCNTNAVSPAKQLKEAKKKTISIGGSPPMLSAPGEGEPSEVEANLEREAPAGQSRGRA
jgi:hypothetical protein